MAEPATLSSQSFFSPQPTESSSSQVASLSPTPPTSVSPDTLSLASDNGTPKPSNIAAPLLEEPPIPQDQAAVEQCEREPDSGERVETSGPVLGPEPLLAHTEFQLEAESSPEAAQGEPELDDGQKTPVAQAIIVAAGAAAPSQLPSTGRSRRTRATAPVYNLAKLSGTAIHGKRRANGDPVREKHRRTATNPGDALADDGHASTDTLARADALVRDGIDALDMNWSIAGPNTPRTARSTKKTELLPKGELTTRRATRSSGVAVETLATKVSSLTRRGRKTFEKSVSRLSRELARLQDTDEFSHIDKGVVVHTVWSNGKYVDPSELAEEASAAPPRKKTKTAASLEDEVQEEVAEDKAEGAKTSQGPTKFRVKKWLEKGLYAGQKAPVDITMGLTAQEKRKLSQIPELASSTKFKDNKYLPLPMYNGVRLLLTGRDFKLPYDIFHPLPPGQPKPAAYRTMTRNRFIGDAAAYWKKNPHFNDFQSKCVCKPEDGCAEQCQNRIMLYECDETNCNIGKAHCTNRAFQTLQERTKQGGRFRIGVEVFKTGDRGYGVRSNRCFEPNQIIMEYTGEIITEEECERRMNELYKDNECYYLMSFDQNMIIDATTGSIARFVNHSCSPNSRMVKWIVSGQPRMALFAGDRPIMTGEELTYDYNFDPFSSKNVQKCLCGSDNCRGVLGPKSREPKLPKQTAKEESGRKSATGVKAGVKADFKAGKRKFKELLAGDADVEGEAGGAKSAKRRKIAAASNKRSLSSSGIKGAASAALKRSVSGISAVARAALLAKGSNGGKNSSSSTPRRASTGNKGSHEVIRTSKAAMAAALAAAGLKAGDGNKRATSKGKATPKKTTPAKKVVTAEKKVTPKKPTPKKITPRKVTPKKATPKKSSVTTTSKRAKTASSTKTADKIRVATPSSSTRKAATSATKAGRGIVKGSAKKRSLLLTLSTTKKLSTAPASPQAAPSAAASPYSPPSSSPPPRKRVPSRKVIEAATTAIAVAESAARSPKSPKSPRPRKALELSRAAKIRLVGGEE